MIDERTFVVADKGAESSIVFRVGQGIQQGTVTSPILYSLYASDILQTYGLNKEEGMNALAFADDLIAYTTGSKIYEIEDNLEDLMRRIYYYYQTWKLKINLDKCETILFRPPITNKNSHLSGKWKQFQIRMNGIDIPHKREVKYLGIFLDDRLLFNKLIHLDHKLEKANKAFIALKGLFFNAHIDRSPEAFPFLDARGFIQDDNDIPILYHIGRNRNNKKILIDPLLDIRRLNSNLRYNKAFFRKKSRGKARLEKKQLIYLTLLVFDTSRISISTFLSNN